MMTTNTPLPGGTEGGRAAGGISPQEIEVEYYGGEAWWIEEYVDDSKDAWWVEIEVEEEPAWWIEEI